MACTILALLIVDGPSSVWIIYVVAILYGAADAVTASALSALIHSTVPPDDLATVNGALQVIREGLRVVAPLLGAGLYAWVGPHTVVVIDAATFALAGLCLLLVRVAEDSPAGAGQMTFDELMAGFRHIASSSALRLVVSTTTAAFLVLGFSQTIMFALATDALGQPSSFVGVLASAQGAGAVLGGVTAARLTRAAGEVRLLGLGLVAFSSGAGLCLLPETPFVLAGMIAIGIAISWSIVGFNTSIQLRTGASLQGRAYSAAETSVAAAQTGSIAVGAFLMTLVGYVPMLIATLVVMGLAALPLIRYRDPGAVHRELTHL
jgi:Na+/melibiose symporter-like transporter